MNFFEHQQRARRKTGVLVFYFLLAVTLIVTAVNAAAYLAFTVSDEYTAGFAAWLREPYWTWISLAVLALILIGSVRTFFRIRNGGRSVAELVGARRVDSASQDAQEQQLTHVVEEMSIASGTPVPEIYVMDQEPAINAFVAGFSPTASVLVVTQGALEQLPRDELQGVIAHEYSHILNGDTRINMRLLGILGGILLIGQLGRVLMRSGGRRSRKQGNAVVVGFSLFVIGYVGLFFGRLIQAAISRQREFLADASSVQFTRNPAGIAGALWRIGEQAGGSRLNNAHADDLGHFCFGQAVKLYLSSWLATHPPIDVRIKAVDPAFLIQRRLKRPATESTTDRTQSHPQAPAPVTGFAANPPGPVTAAGVAASVGRPTPAHHDEAARLLETLPRELRDALHTAATAKLSLYALIIAEGAQAMRPACLKLLASREPNVAAAGLMGALSSIAALPAGSRLTAFNLALPALKTLAPGERTEFVEILKALVRIDAHLSVFEFTAVSILEKQLAPTAGRAEASAYFNYRSVMPELGVLMSALSRAGATTEQQATAAYEPVMRYFTNDPPARISLMDMEPLGTALDKLGRLAPLLKKSLIQACADCVIHDGKILPGEAELLQAVAERLDCPLPPLVPVHGNNIA